MRKHGVNRSTYYKYATIALFVVFLIFAGFFLLNLWEKGREGSWKYDPEDPYVKYDGKNYQLKSGIETFLVLGLDKFEGASSGDSYNNDKQADFLMLLVLDNDAKTCSALHINRDTMTDVNILGVAGNRIDTETKQIALAHTYGNGKEVSCRNTSDAVSSLLLGAKIDHYISVTMDSVPVYNDLVGGVELEVLDDFVGIDASLIKGEKITLKGEQALTYVRTRYGLEDSSNSKRMERQRQYLNALYKKTLSCIDQDENFIVESTLSMADYIVSDRSVNQLQDLLKKFFSYEFVEINKIDGESKVGEQFVEFYPDRESIEAIVIDLFYEIKD